MSFGEREEPLGESDVSAPVSADSSAPAGAPVEKRLSTKANMVWNAVGNFVYLFLQWLLTYVVVRQLGYESAGVFSICIALGNSFYSVALYSMRNYQASDVVDEYSNAVYLRSRWVTCCAAFLLCCAFSAAMGYPGATVACVVSFMAFRVSEAFSDVYQGMMQKRSRMDYIGISFLIRGIAGFAVFCAAVLVTHDLLVAITAMMALSFLVVLLYDRRYARCGGKREGDSMASVWNLLLTCLPLAVYGFLFNSMAQVPRLFIEGVMGTEQLGYYATVAMPVVIVQVSATFVFAPLVTPMAEQVNAGDIEGFRETVKKAAMVIIVLSVAAFLGFGLLGDPVYVFVFGESIAPYTYLILPLVLCTALTALAWYLAAVVVVMREHRALLAMSAVSFAITVAGSWWFVVTFGLNGASFVLAIALAVFCIWSAAVIVRGVNRA